MIEFLEKIINDNNTINEIINHNNQASIFDLSCNQEDCLKIINYFLEIGITNIDELLIYRIDIFKMNFQDLIKKFSKFNIPVLVSLINDDFVTIDNIFTVEKN